MKLPDIGDSVTVYQGLELCRYFCLGQLADRIEAQPDRYRPWVFDGCSGVDDYRVLKIVFGSKWRTITFLCCLTHDLRYAYGDPANEAERKRADKSFRDCLNTRALIEGWQVRIFYAAVRIFGARYLKASFSWGFATR